MLFRQYPAGNSDFSFSSPSCCRCGTVFRAWHRSTALTPPDCTVTWSLPRALVFSLDSYRSPISVCSSMVNQRLSTIAQKLGALGSVSTLGWSERERTSLRPSEVSLGDSFLPSPRPSSPVLSLFLAGQASVEKTQLPLFPGTAYWTFENACLHCPLNWNPHQMKLGS